MTDLCHCGHDRTLPGPHPCHGGKYTCRQPAKIRYYEPVKRYSLAGVQLKISVTSTYACDDCWAQFVVMLNER